MKTDRIPEALALEEEIKEKRERERIEWENRINAQINQKTIQQGKAERETNREQEIGTGPEQYL